MTKAALFWTLMLLWVIFFGAWRFWPAYEALAWGAGLIPFALFALLGWQVFGRPVQ